MLPAKKEEESDVSGGNIDGEADIVCCMIDNENVEVTCCNMAAKQVFPKGVGLLKDPNIWIADTATTIDLTGHASGLEALTR